MSSDTVDDVTRQTVLNYVNNGEPPGSEDVASAELPASALPALLADLQKARDQVKVWVNPMHCNGSLPDSDTDRNSPTE